MGKIETMVKQNVKRPLVAVAVREAGTAERLSRELKSRVAGADLATFVGEALLRDAISSNRARPIDILVADPAMARLAAGLLDGDRMPLGALISGTEANESLLRLATVGGFTILRLDPEPHPFSGVSMWVAGAVIAVSKGLADRTQAAEYSKRYEELVHALPDIVYELDIEGVITFVNESVSILGYVPSDLVGKHYSVLLHDDDASAVDRDKVLPDFVGYRTGLALSPKLFNERRGIDRRTTDLEVRLRKKPGATGHAREMIGSVISYGEISAAGEYARDEQGEFKGSVGIIRDVTLRRKSEEMLRKLYQAIDQLGSCVFVLNHEFEVEYVNPSFFMLSGYSPPEVIGKGLFSFFSFQPDKADRIAKTVRDGFESREEVLVPRSSGGQFWADFSMAPVRSPSGAITHAIAIIEDVSTRKSMEVMLRNARSDAEVASQAKTRFLSSMTHELKNPITGIISAARLLQVTSVEAPDKAAAILENAEKLLEILTGILDYVRSENFEASIQRLSFPLVAFMERTCGQYRKEAEAKGLAFSMNVESDEVIESDPDRLGRVVAILVDNAIKYTAGGSVSVAAAMERREGNVPHLVVQVRDTGAGIALSDHEFVFKPFSRSDSREHAVVKGAGIGLALARNIVMVLGGELRMSSELGSGSVFTVIVPAASPVKAAVGEAARYTVLVVDDNEVNLEYMRTLLENSGLRVHCASSAAQAFTILESRYVDAGLLDIQMPVCSGTELARAIRAYAGSRYSPSMPLFAMTAQDRDTIEDAETLFHDVFPKPTDIRKLYAALAAAMAEREAISAAAFSSAFTSTGPGLSAAVGRIKLEVDGAMTALGLALAGTTDVRIDIRTEASILSQAFQRFLCKSGKELVTLFVEHYPDEDREVLSGLLERIRLMLATAISAANLASCSLPGQAPRGGS